MLCVRALYLDLSLPRVRARALHKPVTKSGVTGREVAAGHVQARGSITSAAFDLETVSLDDHLAVRTLVVVAAEYQGVLHV